MLGRVSTEAARIDEAEEPVACVPLIEAVNTTVVPLAIVWLDGCCVITGAVPVPLAFTVSVAVELVTVPAVFETVTL